MESRVFVSLISTLTIGTGITPVRAPKSLISQTRLADFTAGGEFRPAPKLYDYMYIILATKYMSIKILLKYKTTIDFNKIKCYI